MSDLVERLTLCVEDPMWADHVEMPKPLLAKAISELSRLRKEVADLRGAARPFAGDKVPCLRRTILAYDGNGLRRMMSPMEIAMLRIRRLAALTEGEQG